MDGGPDIVPVGRYGMPARIKRGEWDARFETEAAYLDRLGLWLPGELERIDWDVTGRLKTSQSWALQNRPGFG